MNRNGDSEQVHTELETARLALARRAEQVLAEERRLGAITREYNAAHAGTRRPIEPAVNQQLSGAEQPERPRRPVQPEQPAQSAFIQRPTYSTPDKNLRAAEQIALELEDLEGDERREQSR